MALFHQKDIIHWLFQEQNDHELRKLQIRIFKQLVLDYLIQYLSITFITVFSIFIAYLTILAQNELAQH